MEIKVSIAYQIGTAHSRSGVPCQDHVRTNTFGGCRCAALADGAGGVEHSEIASKIITEWAAKEISENFENWFLMPEEEISFSLVNQCREYLSSQELNIQADCTLLVFAVNKDGRYLQIHIGDGAIFGIYKNDQIMVLSLPENGDEPNQTFFLSGYDAPLHLRCSKGKVNDLKNVLLCSDGISGSLWDKNTGEYASAILHLSEWQRKEDEEIISKVLDRELNETFREHTRDDMSIALLSFLN